LPHDKSGTAHVLVVRVVVDVLAHLVGQIGDIPHAHELGVCLHEMLHDERVALVDLLGRERAVLGLQHARQDRTRLLDALTSASFFAVFIVVDLTFFAVAGLSVAVRRIVNDVVARAVKSLYELSQTDVVLAERVVLVTLWDPWMADDLRIPSFAECTG